MKLHSTTHEPHKLGMKMVSRLLAPHVRAIASRNAFTLYSPNVTFGFALVGYLLLALAFFATGLGSGWFGYWLILLLCFGLGCACVMMALRDEAVDLIRFDRRGMTICSTNFRRRRRRLVRLVHLSSCRAHRDWVPERYRQNGMGPYHALILRFEGEGNSILVLTLGEYESLNEIGHQLNGFIQNARTAKGHSYLK